jgi:hypothetical protein
VALLLALHKEYSTHKILPAMMRKSQDRSGASSASLFVLSQRPFSLFA